LKGIIGRRTRGGNKCTKDEQKKVRRRKRRRVKKRPSRDGLSHDCMKKSYPARAGEARS
jgi:hypothetical protein